MEMFIEFKVSLKTDLKFPETAFCVMGDLIYRLDYQK